MWIGVMLELRTLKYVCAYMCTVYIEPEFRDIPRRLKRYLFAKRYIFRSKAAQQGFQLFSCRDVGKPYFVHSFRTT
jgi:hypothetical protein